MEGEETYNALAIRTINGRFTREEKNTLSHDSSRLYSFDRELPRTGPFEGTSKDEFNIKALLKLQSGIISIVTQAYDHLSKAKKVWFHLPKSYCFIVEFYMTEPQ